jgi:hypothetical protein
VGVRESNGLAIKIGNLESSKIVVVGFVLGWESLNKTTQLGIFQLLLNTGIETHDVLIVVSRRVSKATTSSCVV